MSREPFGPIAAGLTTRHDRDTENWPLQAEMDVRADEDEDARQFFMWDHLGEDD